MVPPETTDTDAPTEAAPSPGVEVAEEAIVFIPGLSLGLTKDRTLSGVVDRLTQACDQQSEARSTAWDAKWHAGNPKDPSTRRATIVRKDGDGPERAMIDIYEFAWSDRMVERWEKEGARQRIFRGLLGFWYGVKLTTRLFRGSETLDGGAVESDAKAMQSRRKLQALLCLVMLLIVAVYLIGIIAAAISAIITTSDMLSGDALNKWVSRLQWVALILTAGLTFVLPQLRGRIPEVGAALLAASDYIRLPSEPDKLAGEFAEALETIAARDGHERVQVVTYSFGSLVALDSLFPHAAPPVRSLDGVDRLVMIGPPFAFARATRKSYFAGRQHGAVPTSWTTYWSRADLISSPQPVGPDVNQPVQLGVHAPEVKEYNVGLQLTFANMLSFYGFSSHSLYWADDGELDRNVFLIVVKDLFPPPSKVLAAPTSGDGAT